MLWLGYTRVSRVGDRGDRLISPELQRTRIDGLVEARGWQVEHLEPELDVSGRKARRPVLDEAIARVGRGEAAGVIVAQLDRLSRMEMSEALATIKRVEDLGGQVVSVAENFDPTTPEGRMVRNIFLSVGSLEWDRKAAALAASKRRAVEVGTWPMAKVPLGYLKHPESRGLVPDPVEAPKVVRAFELRASGAPWVVVGGELGRGHSSAKKVVGNRVYLGEIRLLVEDELVVNPAAHEPLVSRAVWEAAQLSHPRPPRGPVTTALLSKLIRCAGCRGAMSMSRSHDTPIYRCASHMRVRGRCEAPAVVSASLVEGYVEGVMLPIFDAVHRRGAAVVSDDLEAALAELERAETELASFQEGVSASGVGVELLSAGIRSRVNAVDSARRQVAAARLREQPQGRAVNLAEEWPSLSVERRNRHLRGALGVVWVRKGRRPVSERVRLVAQGFEPRDLPVSGRSGVWYPLEWTDADLPGELGV